MYNKLLDELLKAAENEPVIEYLDMPYEFELEPLDNEIDYTISDIVEDEIKRIGKGVDSSYVEDIIEEIQIMQNKGELKNERI